MTKNLNPTKQESLLEETLNRIKTSPLRSLGSGTQKEESKLEEKESPKCQ